MSKIVSVHSYRGGTGKSNLTSNLASCIAAQGKRVGIVDTDIQSPGVHMLFGLEDDTIDFTLNNYLWGECAIKEAAYDVSHVLKKWQSASNGTVYLIPSSVKTNHITRILREGYDEEMLIAGFQELVKELQLDYLFIDTHPGINEETLHSIAISNLLVLILRPDYQDYQGTAVTVELARMLAVSEMLLVVNKALPIFNLDDFRQQIEAAYNVSVAGVFPLCEELAHLASSDIFCLRYPNHHWSEIVRTVAKRIVS
ncbi:MAG: MinD/ParA family protein [Cyanobacteria bacterium CRU_2_1]|nr:MinD/ParA family protein [Cyanobacteria bacterium CRU_2_1]